MRFHSKIALPPATYDVISPNHSKYSKLVLKCVRRINEQLQKTSSAAVLSSIGKKIRKPCWLLPTRQLASLSARVRRES